MPNPTPDQIRRIFLSPRPHLALMTAADLLGMTMKELKKDIDEGVIVAISTGVGVRITREEMIAAAMRLWEQTVIEDALGDDAAAVLPEAIRLVLLRVRVPRYQRDMLVALAQRHGVSVDEIVSRELEDVACAYAEELADTVPSLRAAFAAS
ncbi:MAG TPA: hypothetical protein VEO54_18925 [Thermoanaerobaculia bacterium]|nr:hypothetical protein [Thermoanaerobaculia bacterium]